MGQGCHLGRERWNDDVVRSVLAVAAARARELGCHGGVKALHAKSAPKPERKKEFGEGWFGEGESPGGEDRTFEKGVDGLKGSSLWSASKRGRERPEKSCVFPRRNPCSVVASRYGL